MKLIITVHFENEFKVTFPCIVISVLLHLRFKKRRVTDAFDDELQMKAYHSAGHESVASLVKSGF